jgi:peptidyl-dipeptidase A
LISSRRDAPSSTLVAVVVSLFLVGVYTGCSPPAAAPADTLPSETTKQSQSRGKQARPTSRELLRRDSEEARRIVTDYVGKLSKLEKALSHAYMATFLSASPRLYQRRTELEMKLRRLRSESKVFRRIASLKKKGRVAPATLSIQIELMYRAFLSNQISQSEAEEIESKVGRLEQSISRFRPKLAGRPVAFHDLEEWLAYGMERGWWRSRSRHLRRVRANLRRSRRVRGDVSGELREVWLAAAAMGGEASGRASELFELRSEAARKLGYDSYYDMMLEVDGVEPERLDRLVAELRQKTDEAYRRVKAWLDKALSARLKVPVSRLRPWHYGGLFLERAPRLLAKNLDDRFAAKGAVKLASKFFSKMGFRVGGILARSDLAEKPGKQMGAYCARLDRGKDIRVLATLKQTRRSTATLVHELGHAVYFKHIDPSMDYLLRQPAHMLIAEGVSRMLESAVGSPIWLEEMGVLKKQTARRLSGRLARFNVADTLIFMRWAMVVTAFEKEMYRRPKQDPDRLWWKLTSDILLIEPPDKSPKGVWAAKHHLIFAPVYFQNYLLGELFAHQLLRKMQGELQEAQAAGLGSDGYSALRTLMSGERVASYLIENVFKPGASLRWPRMVQRATGGELDVEAFLKMVSQSPFGAGRPDTGHRESSRTN